MIFFPLSVPDSGLSFLLEGPVDLEWPSMLYANPLSTSDHYPLTCLAKETLHGSPCSVSKALKATEEHQP